MPTLIVGEERNLSELDRRLFQPRVSGDARTRIIETIRESNPHVDLEHLEPGTVLTVPEAPEVRVRDEVGLDELTKQAIAQASELLNQTLEEVVATEKEQRRQAKSDRAALRAALKSNKLHAAARRDKEIAAMIEAAQEQVELEEKQDKERTAVARKAFTQWSKDLEQLRSLLH